MALEEARAVAQQLIEVDTNKIGGTVLYNQRRYMLREMVARFPPEFSAKRSHVERLMSQMERRFTSKTIGSWRPFVVCMLRALGADSNQLDTAIRSARLPCALQALEIAEKESLLNAEGKLAHVAIKSNQLGTLVSRDKDRRIIECVHIGAASQVFASKFQAAQPQLQCERAAQENKQKVGRHRQEHRTPQATVESESHGTLQQSDVVAKQEAYADIETAPRSDSACHVISVAEPDSVTTSSSSRKRALTQAQGIERFMVAKRPEAKKQKLPSSDDTAKPEARQANNDNVRIPDPEGYYACLGLDPSASADDIRAAYKKTVLIHHPDKGGEASSFRAVVCAYTILSDPEKRMEYDGKFGSCSQVHSSVAEPKRDMGDNSQAAGDLYVRMQLTPEQEWWRLLQGADSSVMEMLASELESVMNISKKSDRKGTRQSNDHEAHVAQNTMASPDELHSHDSDYSEKGLKRKKDGSWWVQIGWRNFKVTSAEGIDSMERAVNLHDALIQVRNLAMARYRSAVSDLKELNCAGVGRKTNTNDLETCPVLLDTELVYLLQAEPYVLLVFSSDLAKPKDSNTARIQTNWASFQKAMRFRMLARAVQASPHGKVDELRNKMTAEAKEERIDRFQSRQKAAEVLRNVVAQSNKEVCARQTHQVADAEQKILALTESTHEEIESLKETVVALEARISAQEEVRRETEDAWASRIREMQEHHEKKLQELDIRTKQEQLEMRFLQLEERERHQQAQDDNLVQREMLQQQMQAMQEALKAKDQGRLRAHVQMYRGAGTFTSRCEDDSKERKIFEAARAHSRKTQKRENVPRPVRPSALEPTGSYGRVRRPWDGNTVA